MEIGCCGHFVTLWSCCNPQRRGDRISGEEPEDSCSATTITTTAAAAAAAAAAEADTAIYIRAQQDYPAATSVVQIRLQPEINSGFGKNDSVRWESNWDLMT